jgi:thiosulfate reductase cytochrome b subunit
MKASTERKIMRWVHIVISIPIVGFIYGPVADLYYASRAVKFGFFPALVISGLWMWKGHAVKNWIRKIKNPHAEALSK